jgi:NAD(P)H-quinone oxidoreductase subunit N
MALITTGKPFLQDLKEFGALGLYVPPEGGHEGRYQRRLRTAGYPSLQVSAPGLGDLSAYLTGTHGVRPPHLGKNPIRVYFLPPLLTYQLENLSANAKGLVLWLVDGQRLSRQELGYLCTLPSLDPRVKVAVELGGDRAFRWQPLQKILGS